ncbi:MAG: hypothetical protein WBI06_11165, partial [Paludibacter sp.]
MKKIFFLSILMVCTLAVYAQKNDTIYYDANWKGVATKELATYFLVIYNSSELQIGNTAKEFYITG